MLRSMTAFGRATVSSSIGQVTLTLQSVNRKYLEVSVVLPKELSSLEVELKKWLAPHVARGQVTMRIEAAFERGALLKVIPNINFAKQLHQAYCSIASELNIDPMSSLNTFFQHEDLIHYEENLEQEEQMRVVLKEAFEKALKDFVNMKNQEGSFLQQDILLRIDKIRSSIEAIQARGDFSVNKYREKLISRIEELLPGRIENEDRILREVALYAERLDIAEEITRFYSHLEKLYETILQKEESMGKTLEFILQEINRETNTIGSKSIDIEITNQVINIKGEAERIREQIQNVE